MSEPDASDSPPADLPRLRIIHLLGLTTVFSIVMSVNLGFMRLLQSSQPNMEMPEISGGISVLMIVQFLSISVCLAVVGFGFAWQRRGIAFPSQPGHWVAVYWTLTWFFDWVSYLVMLLPSQWQVNDSIQLVMALMSLALSCLVAYLWVVAYWQESTGIWKWYLMSAMARNLGLVMRSLFGFGTARSLQAEGDFAGVLYLAWINIQSMLKRLIATLNRTSQKIADCHAFTLAA